MINVLSVSRLISKGGFSFTFYSKIFSLSKYTYLVKVGSNKYLYNLRTNAIVKISKPSLLKIQSIFEGKNINLEESLIIILIYSGILINRDEFELIKDNYKKNLYNNKWLTLKILSTLNCNFNCSYCFEKKKDLRLSNKAETFIKEYVNTQLDSYQGLSIAWFGGEPLLETKSIIRLTKYFRSICFEKNKEYISSLTTNGFLLHKIITEIEPLKIKHIQITLDGNQDYHDKTRALISGKSSFSTIMSNIERLSALENPINVILRINCTSENIGSIYNLLSTINNSIKKRVVLYFKWIWTNGQCGYKIYTGSLSDKKQYEIISDLYEYAIISGFKIKNPSFMYPIFCEVDNTGFLQIAPDGSIHLCSETYSDNTTIGSLNEESYLSYPLNWLKVSPFDDLECIECDILPICKGGCRFARYNGQRKCIQEKIDINRLISLEILSSINFRNNT